MRRLRRPGSFDPSTYARGVVVLVKHPVLVVPMVVAHFAVTLLFGTSGGGGLAGGFILGLLVQAVLGIALGLVLIGADAGWRERRVSLRGIWEEGRLRLREILIATFLFNFALYAASYVGGLFAIMGPIGLVAEIGLYLAALFLLLYALPAASIGGVQGQASLNLSVEQARAQPVPTGVLTAFYAAFFFLVPTFVAPVAEIALRLAVPLLPGFDLVFTLVETLLLSICETYVGVVLAKVYDDLATRRFFFR